MRTSLIATLIAAGLLTTAACAGDRSFTSANHAQWLSIPEIHAKVEAAGFHHIEEIERESGSYEVKATDNDGRRVKMYVHPLTGEIMQQRRRGARHGGYARRGDDGRPGRDGRPQGGYDSGGDMFAAGVECTKRRCRDDAPQSASQLAPQLAPQQDGAGR